MFVLLTRIGQTHLDKTIIWVIMFSQLTATFCGLGRNGHSYVAQNIKTSHSFIVEVSTMIKNLFTNLFIILIRYNESSKTKCRPNSIIAIVWDMEWVLLPI